MQHVFGARYHRPVVRRRCQPGLRDRVGVGTFTVTAVSASTNTFSINRVAGGGYTRTCTAAGNGGCKTGATW